MNLQVARKAWCEESKTSLVKKDSPEQREQLPAIVAAGAVLQEASVEVDNAERSPHGHHLS